MATITPDYLDVFADLAKPLRAPVSRGTTVDLVHGVVPSDVYRTDWQGQQRLYPTARTNQLLWSQDLSNAAWTKLNITATQNAAIAPDGTMTATKIQATATALTNLYRNTVMAGSGAGGVLKVFAKKGSSPTTCNSFGLRNSTTLTNLGIFTINYDTGVITHTVGSGATAVDRGNGWWEIGFSAASGVSAGDTITTYAIATGPSVAAGEYAYAWGGMFSREGGSYIPTTTAPVTVTDYTLDSAGMVTLASAVDDRKGEFISGDFPSTIARVGP